MKLWRNSPAVLSSSLIFCAYSVLSCGLGLAQQDESLAEQQPEQQAEAQVLQELEFQQDHPFLLALREKALMALADNVPELAVKDFQLFFAALEERKAKGLPELFTPEQRAVYELALLEALVRSGQWLPALEFAQTEQFAEQEAGKLYWQAQAQMGLQRWRGARDTLRKAEAALQAQQNSNAEALPPEQTQPQAPLAGWIGLARAQVMAVVARPESEVEAKIAELLNSGEPALQRRSREFALAYFFSRKRFGRVEELLAQGRNELQLPLQQLWQARIAQARGQHAEAVAQLQGLLGLTPEQFPSDLSPQMQAQTVLSLAQSYRALGQDVLAQNLLLRQLAARPNNPLFVAQALLLAELPWLQTAEAEVLLGQWAQGAAQSLAQAATYLQALRAETAQDWPQAKQLFERLWQQDQQQQGQQGLGFRPLAGLKLSQLLAREGKLQQALAILDSLQTGYPEQSQELEQESFPLFLRAQASLQAGKRQEALDLLAQVEGEQGALAAELAWNQALIYLQQPLAAEFVQAVEQVEQGDPDTEQLEDGKQKANQLRLAALLEAIKRDEPEAIFSLLGEFEQVEPQSPQLAQALLNSSRWALGQDPATLDMASWMGWLQRARPAAPEQQFELGAMQLRLALHGGDTRMAAQILETLLATQPANEQLPPLRLELAQAQFLQGDFAGALLQYDLFLRVVPEGESAHLARYGAAYATMQLPAEDALANAVQRFGVIVADKSSPFRVEALLQQLFALQRLGELQTAAEVLNEALKEPWTQERRAEMENRLSEMEFPLGGEARKRAFKRWQNLRNNPQVPLLWRECAAWHEAQARESLNQAQKALELYREVVLGMSNIPPDKPQQQETTPRSEDSTQWFHASVASGVELLKEQENWQAAVALLKRAASRLPAEQAKSYRQQAETLRLQHFLETP